MRIFKQISSVQVSNWFKNRRQRERVPPQKEPMMGEHPQHPQNDQIMDESLSQGKTSKKSIHILPGFFSGYHVGIFGREIC